MIEKNPEDVTIQDVKDIELYGWIGLDEFGDGKLGIKAAIVPAGIIPMVAIDREKMEKYWDQAERVAAGYGCKIFLLKFKAVEIIRATTHGEPSK